MILFDLSKSLEGLDQTLNGFLEQYSKNPLFWSFLLIALFAFASWGIQYLNKK